MLNTRFGNFSELAQGKKPMTAEEAWIMLKQLGLLGQEFIPGATSVRKLIEGKPREAVEELQNWIPGNDAYQNFIRGKEQDWLRNALDAMIIAKPVARGVKKTAEAIEKMPKGGKEGFITVTKGDKLKDIIKRAEEAGQGLSKEEEEHIRKIIGYINESEAGNRKAMAKFLKESERLSPNESQVFSAFLEAKTKFKNKGLEKNLKMLDLGDKPEGFNNWAAKDRIKYMDEHAIHSVDGFKPGYGVINTKIFSPSDYDKALYDLALEEKTAVEAPITMTEVKDLSTGILPSENSSVARGGTGNTYDHSRPFMNTELKEVPRIDRTGMSYGDNTDAFYDIYKAWRNSNFRRSEPLSKKLGYDTEGTEALRELKKEAIRGKNQSKDMIIRSDPYYAAGVVGDENKRLWDRIKALRKEGKTDTEIREMLKRRLNNYQGQLERLKERMPSKGHNSQFNYDGAITQRLKATPSEEARALKALGVDTPEYDDLERLGNFYRVFFPE